MRRVTGLANEVRFPQDFRDIYARDVNQLYVIYRKLGGSQVCTLTRCAIQRCRILNQIFLRHIGVGTAGSNTITVAGK